MTHFHDVESQIQQKRNQMELLPINYNIQKIQEQILQMRQKQARYEEDKLQSQERAQMINEEKQQRLMQKMNLIMEIEDTEQMLDMMLAKDQQVAFALRQIKSSANLDSIYQQIVLQQ